MAMGLVSVYRKHHGLGLSLYIEDNGLGGDGLGLDIEKTMGLGAMGLVSVYRKHHGLGPSI